MIDLEYCKITGVVSKGGKPIGSLNAKGYLHYRNVSLHRIAWFIHYGSWPEYNIDHINGDKLDNRIGNLRSVTQSENCKNRAIPKSNASGVHGVYWDKHANKWKAQIRVNGRAITLGRSSCIDELKIARKEAEIKYGFHENHGRNNSIRN